MKPAKPCFAIEVLWQTFSHSLIRSPPFRDLAFLRAISLVTIRISFLNQTRLKINLQSLKAKGMASNQGNLMRGLATEFSIASS